MDKLKTRVSKMREVDKLCCVLFDEISLSANLTYSPSDDRIVGYEDLGELGVTNRIANHALVFMVRGICKSWKQPICYYFTKDTVSTINLKKLICEVISQLQSTGLKVISTVCDLGPTNRKAIRCLKKETSRGKREGPYFFVNGERIVALFDTPHLLKCTRNALCKYNIRYVGDKIAKFQHLIQAYEFDKNRRFKTLYKVRESYLRIEKYPMLKMKVSVAAKTLSNTMAAAIETMMCHNNISSAALSTAEFVHDVNDLFDSFNSTAIYKNSANPPLRCALTAKSRHIIFWNNMLSKINSWQFISRKNDTKKTLPFKEGWINNIQGMKIIWDVCQSVGMKFLRTRAFNQDPVENLFSVIRQHGAANTNPNCYQFIGALKSSVLSDLIANKSSNRNCEDDGGSVLDNLRDFLTGHNELAKPILNHENDNELLKVEVPPFTKFSYEIDPFESQALAYVTGFLIKKIKDLNCNNCKKSLLVSNPEPQHTFTNFKEYDSDKLRLKYATKDCISYVALIHDIAVFYLENFASARNVLEKLRFAVAQKINFSWFACHDHKSEVEMLILNSSLRLILNKFIADCNQKFQDENRKKKTEKKINTFQHL